MKLILVLYVAAIAAVDAAIIAQRVANHQWQITPSIPLSTAWAILIPINATGLAVAYILGRMERKASKTPTQH